NANREGILGNDLYTRNALNINLNSNLFNNSLKLSLTSKGSFDDNVFADRGAIGSAVAFDPTMPIYSDGSAFDGFFEYTETNGKPVLLAPKNPVALLKQNNNKARNKRNITNLNAVYTLPFLKELSISANAGFDYSELKGQQFISENSATQLNGRFRNYYSG